MAQLPIHLSPEDVSILIRCPLHYHFRQQQSALPNRQQATAGGSDDHIRSIIQQLHATGGPERLSLRSCLRKVAGNTQAQRMIERYYGRLRRDWPRVIASNETMTLKISIAGVPLVLQGTIDRLDKTQDGGVLAILLRLGSDPLPKEEKLRREPALTIYHALVAATYPLKRPVRIQELWLHHNQDVTVELSEEEYRHNLSLLREPILALNKGEVRARPGLHCDSCPFQYHGCPVYLHDQSAKSKIDDFDPAPSDGKIPGRQWIFKI